MPVGIYTRKKGIKYGNTGHMASPEKLEKLRLSHLGQKAWNKGLKGVQVSTIKGLGDVKKNCLICNKEFITKENRIKNKGGKYCSRKCQHISLIGRIQYIDTIEKRKKSLPRGIDHHCFGKNMSGENNPRWLKDRSKVKITEIGKLNIKYKVWSREVKERDGWKCKIQNKDCSGRIESHHILSYTNYPELRYDINNGITLCHKHHPRKRSDELVLIPVFKELINIK